MTKYYGSVSGVVILIAVDASGPTTALTSVTPRRLRDLPAHRRAAANANTVLRSQPVASTSQSSPQSTHCPVCLMVICDIAIIPCGHCLCCTCFQNITSTVTGCARCPVCRTDISDTIRLHFSA